MKKKIKICTVQQNCVQHVRSSGQGAIVCKSCSTHRALITRYEETSCPLAIKFDSVEITFIFQLYFIDWNHWQTRVTEKMQVDEPVTQKLGGNTVESRNSKRGNAQERGIKSEVGSTILWASGRVVFPLEWTWFLTPLPQNSFRWEYKPRFSLCSHAFHRRDSKEPDIHILDGWMLAAKTHPAYTIYEYGMWLPLWLD